MSAQPIPVTVVGYGSSARTFHIPFITSLPAYFTLHSIQQRPGSKSGPPASDAHPNVAILPTFESVLTELPKPGLIVITTSNATHFPFAKQALEAGYHVIVEKPITWKVDEAEELVALSASKGLVCASFNNRRWDCDYLTVKSLLKAASPDQPSAIGTPTFFESRFDRFRPWTKGGWREESGFEQGGGLLLDLGSHLADQRECRNAVSRSISRPLQSLTLLHSFTQCCPSLDHQRQSQHSSETNAVNLLPTSMTTSSSSHNIHQQRPCLPPNQHRALVLVASKLSSERHV